MKQLYSILTCLLWAAIVNAQTTVSFTADKDNTIYSTPTNNSNGMGEYLSAGRNGGNNGTAIQRGLLHFNISSIPTNATIASATLTIYCEKSASTATALEVHKLLQSWGEGASDAAGTEGSGTTAQPGDATWSHSFYSTTTWTNGGNFSPTVSASMAVDANIGSSTEIVIAGSGLAADVQSWLPNATNNFGWLLKADDENSVRSVKKLISRNNTVAAQRPTLSVTYNVNLPVTLKSFTALLKNNDVHLTWSTAAEINHHLFDIQHSNDGRNFTSIGTMNGLGSGTSENTYNFIHKNVSGAKHYYRLGQQDLNGFVKYSNIIVVSLKGDLQLQLQPNPALGFIRITASTVIEGARFTVASAMGQIIVQGIVAGQQVDVQKLSPGTYWLSIETSNGEILKSPFLKN